MMECVGRLVAMAFVRTKVVKNLPKRKKICYNIAPTEQMRSTFFILAVKNFPVKLLRGYRPQGLCDAHNKRTFELLTLGKIQASLFCPQLIAIVIRFSSEQKIPGIRKISNYFVGNFIVCARLFVPMRAE